MERLNTVFEYLESDEAEDILDYALEIVDFLDVPEDALKDLTLRYYCKPLLKEELEKVSNNYRESESVSAIG